MKFAVVAEHFERLENTTKRLEMFEILSQLFKKTSNNDIDKLIYICQERIKPAYEGIEIGMAERMLEKAIARATGTDIKRVKDAYKKKGDLGLVAENFSGKHKNKLVKLKELTLSEVYDGFLRTAKISGTGAIEQKISIISGLLSRANSKEAKYIARFVIGRLRLGIGDPTIMDSLSKAKAGDRSLRKDLERAYNLCSDLGLVAKTFFEKGIDTIRKFKITPGKPIRMALAERLPSSKDIIKKIGKCAVEAKYDGFRCISGYTSIYVKDRGIIPAKDIKKGDYVLTHKGRFKKVIGRMSRVIDKDERVFEFQTYLGDKFKITEKHPVLCLRGRKEKWVNVEELSKLDRLVFPIPKVEQIKVSKEMTLRTLSGYEKKILMDEKFFRFLGFWVGDGYSNEYNKTSRLGLVFNKKTEKKLCEEYKKYIKSAFNIKKIYENVHNGAIYLYWEDKPLLQWLARNFRKQWKSGWRGKTIPSWFFGLDKKRYSAFLKGWIEADGYTDKIGRTILTTKESNLAALNQLLALRFGVIFGLKKFRINKRNYYKLVLIKSKRVAEIRGNKLNVKILKVKELRRRHPREVDPRQRVYNFQVEGDESYCVPMVALHNCQIHKVNKDVMIFSRNLENMTHMFPDIIQEVKKLKQKEIIFEGEALTYNDVTGELYPFQVTITRKRKYEIEKISKKLPLRMFVFALLYVNGKDYTKEPYIKRRKKIESIFKKGEILQPSAMIVTDNPKEMEKFFEEEVSSGLEGVMAKRLDAPYSAGARNYDWIKLKRSYKGELSDTIDVVIVGYLKGKGMRTKFGIGAVLAAVYDKKEDVFKTIAKVGSGFSEKQWVELRKMLDKISIKHNSARVDSEIKPDVWVEPKYVLTVKADEITRSPLHTAGKTEKEDGFALRFPRAVDFIRFDKNPEDANTVKEIKEMFKMQFEHH